MLELYVKEYLKFIQTLEVCVKGLVLVQMFAL